ncbi:MAG: cell wall hydrolase [Rhizomicrobium sp.]
MTLTPSDVETLARTAYGEASSEGDAARIGVISSVLNRAKDGHFPGGTDVGQICTAHRQYDCWDASSADCARTKAATPGDPAYAACLGLALVAAGGKLADNTHGAVFYHDVTRFGPPAAWGKVKLVAVHGRLSFYAKG